MENEFTLTEELLEKLNRFTRKPLTADEVYAFPVVLCDNEIDRDGDMVTPLVPGSEECAYTLFDEDGNCFCSMERCWFQGKGDFRKPISCWLYPIRITELSNGTRALNLHRWHICQDAFAKGKKEKVRVYEFLREPIERYFGEDFYSALSEAAKMLNADS